MNYYLDTEFVGGKQDKKILGFKIGETKPTIDLISIGVVSQDNRQFYEISKEFNIDEAWNRFDIQETSPAKKYMGFYEEKVYWLRDNVLKPIFIELTNKSIQDETYIKKYYYSAGSRNFTLSNFKNLINHYGKTNKQIADELTLFLLFNENRYSNNDADNKINIYGYYSGFDYVVYSWLFGKMIDLPESFPMYFRDLKQTVDEVCERINKLNGLSSQHTQETLEALHPLYPKQDKQNSHSAIHDAIWIKKFHEFLLKL